MTANPVTINDALKEFADAFTSNFSAIVQDGASANAWPMTTYSYLLIHTRHGLNFAQLSSVTKAVGWQFLSQMPLLRCTRTMSECGKAASLLEFIMWTQTNSKAIAIAEAVGYTVRPLAVIHLSWLLLCLFHLYR